MSVQFGLYSVRISFLSLFFFFFLYPYFSWQTLTIHRIAGKGEGIIIFLAFHTHTHTNTREHSFSSSRFLPLLFDQFICNNQTDSWWGLFFLEICNLFKFSLMQLSRSYYWLWHSNWHCEDLSSYQTTTFLLHSERLNQLRLIPLATTVYLSHLPNLFSSHHLSSIRFIFFTRDLAQNSKKHFHSIKIGNDILISI